MRPEEKPEVREMFRRSFAPVKRWFFFSWTPDVLVAERAGSCSARPCSRPTR
jgi:hypothetical protein